MESGELPCILAFDFDLCKPRREVLAGELPDAIFAADLWDVISGTAHKDYRDPLRFFTGTHPTENLKLLVKEVSERLAGVSGGKTHSLIAAVHVAREGTGWLRSSLTTASRSSPPRERCGWPRLWARNPTPQRQ